MRQIGWINSATYHHNDDLILPDLFLGMDILKHLFLAFGELALYIAPDLASGGPPPPVAAPEP